MSAHNLLSKCDRALVAYLITKEAGLSTDILPAKRSLDRPLPCTVCYSEKAVEVAPFSSTYLVSASIMCRSEAALEIGSGDEEARETSDARVAVTFNAFHVDLVNSGDVLADAITAAARARGVADPDHHADLADFTVQNVAIKGIEAGPDDGGAWVDTLELELVCCAADVSDP